MPRVKIDYIVSFSNEDSENQACNLLAWEVSKKKWLCSKGEASCSVVLQLARAVKISSVQIGAHHAALVEVLVGRSETPSEPFQVLVPSSVFLSPAESRGGAQAQAAQRVRSFAGAALAAAAAQRWDRLRVVCSQPYNKHCKYGLSFIHVFEPGHEAGAAAAERAPSFPLRLLALDSLPSDEEDFRPGELFAKHRQSGGDTGSQIRRATSQALKNNPDAATKLIKTPIAKKNPSTGSRMEPESRPRDSDVLLHTEGDERPHGNLDRIAEKVNGDGAPRFEREELSSRSAASERDVTEADNEKTGDSRRAEPSAAPSGRKKDGSRKRPRTESSGAGASGADRELRPGPRCERPLRGVVFVLSGYRNPERARLRDLALSLGARAQRDWGPLCTHLVCAFDRTPKLAQARAQAQRAGAGPPAAPRAEWLRECARRRRLLPWQWFAAEPARRRPERDDGGADGADGDTDDEIEKAVRQRKKARPARSPLPGGAGADEDGDEAEFARDERMQDAVTADGSESEPPGDTDADEPLAAGGARAALPLLLAGRAFALDARLAAPHDVRLLARYCIAYGGLVLEPSDVTEQSGEHYVLCGRGAGAGAAAGAGTRLRADWLWACHREGRLCPTEDYLLDR